MIDSLGSFKVTNAKNFDEFVTDVEPLSINSAIIICGENTALCQILTNLNNGLNMGGIGWKRSDTYVEYMLYLPSAANATGRIYTGRINISTGELLYCSYVALTSLM